MDGTQEVRIPEEIFEEIKAGRAVLFLGAGASHAAGGPMGRKLTERVKEHFTKIDQKLDNFIDVCQDVLDTPPYTRTQLEEFIRQQIAALQPSSTHKIMTKYDWAAIFTTNFDDLIELAYRTSLEAIKPCLPIATDVPNVMPADRSKVHLFKIMGCINSQPSEQGQMVLSRSDYNRAIIRRRKYSEMLFDFVKAGTLIFIGYSFEDRKVLEVIDEVISIYGPERLPWSYAFFKHLELNEKATHMFETRRIRPVECSFEQFFTYIDSQRYTPRKIMPGNLHFKVLGEGLEIPEQDIKQCAEYFEVLTDEKLQDESGSKDEFFMGISKSWNALKSGWDFVRDIYTKGEKTVDGKTFSGGLKGRILGELAEQDIEKNKVILLSGMPGVGKTTLLRRIAYDVYKNSISPVIFINQGCIGFDYRMIAGFIERLNHLIDEKIPGEKRGRQVKPLIVVDDAALFIRHLNRLKDYLTSRGRPVLIVAAERKGEWDEAFRQWPFRIFKENIYDLEEELNANEKREIVEHLHKLGYIQAKGVFWDDIIERDFENSFFATIYTIVHPSKKPLNDIIRDQYKNLSKLTKKAFQYVCLFHQFNIPINLELLVRSLEDCSYNDFETKIIRGEGGKVIFEESDGIGNLIYRSHHRIIAQKTVEFFFADPEEQKLLMLEILKWAVLANTKEKEIVEKLLIEYIGPNAKPQRFTHEQQRQIFRVVCEKNPMRSLLHHWGILETEDHDYEEAKRLLQIAIGLPREEIETYRGESDQNILTSLGNLYSRIGMEKVQKGLVQEAEADFAEAARYFREAKHGEFPNAYAYHAHANMWYQRGNRVNNDVAKLEYYAKALEILAIAEDNLNEDDLQAIYELGSLIWGQLKEKAKVNRNIEILKRNYKTASGYYLYALVLEREASQSNGAEKQHAFKSALQTVEEGLRSFPSDEPCLRMKARLMKELNEDDLSEYFKSLQNWKAAASTPNAWLLYEFARSAFILGYYDLSRDTFQELESGVGLGHRLRSRTRDIISDSNGKGREFEGKVINVFSQYEGEIRCETLRNLRYSIKFRPIACSFTPSRGDTVKFNIGFSFRGAVVINVHKR